MRVGKEDGRVWAALGWRSGSLRGLRSCGELELEGLDQDGEGGERPGPPSRTPGADAVSLPPPRGLVN